MRMRTSTMQPRGRSRRLSTFVAGLCSVALGVGGFSAATLASSPAARAADAANVKVAMRPALPHGATALGPVATTKSISGDVALAPRNAAGLAAYASAVSNPKSPLYQHYLSLASFDAEFAPSAATVSAIESDLRADELKVTSVAGDQMLIGFTGDAARVDAAFHTAIDSYLLPGGRHVFANDSAVELPANLARAVQAVVGLNNLLTPRPTGPITRNRALPAGREHLPHLTPPPGAASPCQAATALANYGGGLTANYVAHAYGLDPLYKAGDFGSGQTVDILDLFGYSSKDILTFDDCYYGSTHGPKVFANDTVTNVDNGAQPGIGTGGSVETTLDTETVNAYAPQAKVDLYLAPDTDSGFLDVIAAMADSSARVESISYGECELDLQAYEPGFAQMENYLLEQGATLGKTVFVSTGDSGSDGLCASDPASQPYATAVGGTAITAATDPPAEDVWNDGAAGGSGGGGISDIWPAPAWQSASTVGGFDNQSVVSKAEKLAGTSFCQADAAYASLPCREVPDVTAQASPNTGGFSTFLDNAWAIWGGTSLSSPTWAAFLADINSTAACQDAGGTGFISPKLYSIASLPAEYAASFNNITIGNNDNDGTTDGLYPATKDYSMAAGLGSPKVTGPGDANGLAYYLCSKPTPAPTVTSLTPTALASDVVSAGTATLTIAGTGFATGGKSLVAGVGIGAFTLPSTAYTVNTATGDSILVNVPKGLFADEIGNGGSGDGSGGYSVTVTLTGGATNAPSASARLLLYDGTSTATATPVVAGTFPQAGVEAGGTAVTIYGSGFTNATAVTFGGVPAASFKVVNDDTITAVTPAYSSSSSTCENGGPSGESAATDVCQAAVQVTANGNSSATPAIPPEYSGSYPPPTAAGEYAAADEYDYEPTPAISNITFVSAPDIASEEGGTLVDMTGTGLGILGLEWINVGSYLDAGNEDYSLVSISSTNVEFALLTPGPTPAPVSVPVTVQTYGSPNSAPGVPFGSVAPSNTVTVPFAPTPSITSLSVAGAKLVAGPTSGGSTLTITGTGFDDSDLVNFVDLKYGFTSTQYFFTLVSNTEIKLTTPAALPGVDAVTVCGVSGCSANSTTTYTYYLPGNPSLTASKPAKGTAGTKVTITGYNLGFVLAVYFGKTKATFSNATFFESGNTYELTAVAPKGTAGSKVYIRVETVESVATGYGKSRVNRRVTFTYRA
jgi:hypothetical protein